MSLEVIEFINEKIIISGNVVEKIKYEKGYIKGGEGTNKNGRSGGSQELTEEEKSLNRQKVLRRGQTRLRRLINANVWQYGDITPKFLTLTFAENIIDLRSANKSWMLFIKRLNWFMFRTRRGHLKYSVVIEFQKRGAVHYHAIFYNLPYIPNSKLREIWGQGFLKINKISDCDNVGAYVTKYMSKNNEDERLKEKRSFFNSRDLLEPLEITDKKMIEKVAGSLSGHEVYSVSYDNEFLGQISHVQYNTKRKQIKKEAVAE